MLFPELRRKARIVLLDWSRRYSGYAAHMASEHPPIGMLEWGDVVFRIRTVTFSDGQMHIEAAAPANAIGKVSGQVMLTGIDGSTILHGSEAHDMGIKTAGSTWKFTWGVRLPEQADDTPAAP